MTAVRCEQCGNRQHAYRTCEEADQEQAAQVRAQRVAPWTVTDFRERA